VVTLVYALCALTSLLCAVLLLSAYVRSRVRLLFWSGLGFAGLAMSNGLMFTDFVVVPEVDLGPVRAAVTFAAISVLLFGLLWEGE
jgi:hypothetical protein